MRGLNRALYIQYDKPEGLETAYAINIAFTWHISFSLRALAHRYECRVLRRAPLFCFSLALCDFSLFVSMISLSILIFVSTALAAANSTCYYPAGVEVKQFVGLVVSLLIIWFDRTEDLHVSPTLTSLHAAVLGLSV
jgi:hypothetical protein